MEEAFTGLAGFWASRARSIKEFGAILGDSIPRSLLICIGLLSQFCNS
jgi:hypothetical protein